MEKEIVAALIGAAATVGAAVLGFMSVLWQFRANKASAALTPAFANGKRTLTLEELEALDVPPPVMPTSGLGASPVSTSGEVEARLVFPGSDRFSGSDREYFSSIKVHLDGESIGSGSGKSGFSLNFKASVGRHTLVFAWTSTWEKRDGSSRDNEERRETVFWLVRSGKCVIHLKDTGRAFEVEHSEPPSAFPNCYGCSFPTNQKCKCGRDHCQKHTGEWLGKKVCAVCHAEALQKTYKWTAIALAVLAVIAGIVYLASRRG